MPGYGARPFHAQSRTDRAEIHSRFCPTSSHAITRCNKILSAALLPLGIFINISIVILNICDFTIKIEF